MVAGPGFPAPPRAAFLSAARGLFLPAAQHLPYCGMGNPWTDCGAAFAPMMTETVGLSGVRKGGAKVATSFAAAVLPDEYEDPAAEDSLSSTVRGVSVTASSDALAGTVPQVGDTLARADGSRWQVKSATLALGLWHIAAREVR